MPLSENSNTESLPARRTGRQINLKRNRRILACAFCREKKVKCDRVQPTCGRCLQGRISCHYTSAPFRDENFAYQLLGIPFPLGFTDTSQKNDLLHDFSLPTSESATLYSNEVSDPASDDHTAGFENPDAPTEPRASLSSQFGLSQNLMYQTRMDHFEPSSAVTAASQRHSETMLYRSPTPRIQFHGSSAAISVIHSTPVILKEVGHILSCSNVHNCSFPNWQFSLRIRRYGANSFHRQRLKP
jgi:Fungal Zn(2)-Cys(6) binuclear cluster domain